METLVTILHVMVCIFLMLTVLLQAGKGGGMGAAFGGGSSMGTVFGGSGAGNFLRRLTVAAAIIFMITSMTLAWMATPSTDPLKEYWAQQQAAAAERERAHKAALGDEAKDAKGEAKDEAGAPENQSVLETGAATEAGGGGETTAPAAATGAAAPTTSSPGAGQPVGGKSADKPATGQSADKPAADKPAADKPAAGKSADKPAPSAPAGSTP